ncbi:hypothetical protein DFJ74DRAFT_11637 [Hyaloraphidium curvatum]|nr:hypothetical protein DFJ74DRAFT_11637 [Hyaloraphidium curvatum]
MPHRDIISVGAFQQDRTASLLGDAVFQGPGRVEVALDARAYLAQQIAFTASLLWPTCPFSRGRIPRTLPAEGAPPRASGAPRTPGASPAPPTGIGARARAAAVGRAYPPSRAGSPAGRAPRSHSQDRRPALPPFCRRAHAHLAAARAPRRRINCPAPEGIARHAADPVSPERRANLWLRTQGCQGDGGNPRRRHRVPFPGKLPSADHRSRAARWRAGPGLGSRLFSSDPVFVAVDPVGLSLWALRLLGRVYAERPSNCQGAWGKWVPRSRESSASGSGGG